MAPNKEIKTATNPEALRELNRLARKYRRDVPAVSSLMDVVGVLADIKPAALIDRKDVPVSLLLQLGLTYETTAAVEHLLYVSQSQAKAKRLATLHAKVFGRKLSPHKEREIGKLLGYPKTSTGYFIKRWSTIGTFEELPMIHVVDTEYTASAYYQQLILSPDNWKEELAAYCEPLEAAVQALAPQVHAVFERMARAEARQHRYHTHIRKLLHRFGLVRSDTNAGGVSELRVKR